MSMEDYNFAKAREAWATPVKIVQYNCLCGRTMKFESEHGVIAPQRTWVGLTEEETSGFTQHEMSVVKYVSKVLQEKNT